MEKLSNDNEAIAIGHIPRKPADEICTFFSSFMCLILVPTGRFVQICENNINFIL